MTKRKEEHELQTALQGAVWQAGREGRAGGRGHRLDGFRVQTESGGREGVALKSHTVTRGANQTVCPRLA